MVFEFSVLEERRAPIFFYFRVCEKRIIIQGVNLPQTSKLGVANDIPAFKFEWVKIKSFYLEKFILFIFSFSKSTIGVKIHLASYLWFEF